MTPQEAAKLLRDEAEWRREFDEVNEADEITALEMGAAALEQQTKCPHCGAEREAGNDQS